jgi:hypothetical protein
MTITKVPTTRSRGSRVQQRIADLHVHRERPEHQDANECGRGKHQQVSPVELAGFLYRPLLLMSAGAFVTMMFFAVVVRIKIRDPIHVIAPAFLLLFLNLLLVVRA